MSPRQPDLALFDTPQRAPTDSVGRALARLEKRRKRQVDYEGELDFQIRSQGLPECARQYYFAKPLGRNFKADFAWPPYKLILEVQGGIWRPGGGAHSHPIDIERDVERLQYIALLRWTVLPVLPKEVMNGAAIELLRMVLGKLGWKPTKGVDDAAGG